jgi:hypothetical protein
VWHAALDIMESCNATNQENFRLVVTAFTRDLLAHRLSHRVGKQRRVSQMLSGATLVYGEGDPPALFMDHPADRFLMLLLSTMRRNTFIHYVLQKNHETRSILETLVNQVADGRFDSYIYEDGHMDMVCLDTEQKEWRSRTCRGMLKQLG